MEYCEECLKNGIYKPGQAHHIVKRSKASYMVHVPINIKYLCLNHHTGQEGVHKNTLKDIEYKQELQLKLKLLFTKDYYTKLEIKKILNISDNTIKAITKTLPLCKEGYEKDKLIFHMMGDVNYL